MIESEVGKKGRELYEATLKAKLEPENNGKYVVVDVDSGDYEIGDEYLFLARRLRARRPNATPFTIRVGYPAVARIGGRARHAS